MSVIEELEKEYDLKHRKSKLLYERAKNCFPSGVTHDSRFVKPFPIYAVKAYKTHKWDVDGNEYVDYIMGHGSLLLGYGDENVSAIMQDYVVKGIHLGSSTELEIEWAELIQRLIPSAHGGLVRAVSSGSEAISMAIRLARLYTNKDKVVLHAGSYHGKSDTTIIGYRGPPYGICNAQGIPNGVKNDVVIIALNDLNAAEESFKEGDVACIILQGNALYTKTYIKGLRNLTKQYGIIFIMDEVVSGMRYAPGGAQEYYEVTPDLTVLGKIIGGGAPIGAICGKTEIMEGYAFKDEHWNKFKRIKVGGSWNAQPITISGGIAIMKIIEKEGKTLYSKLYSIGKRLTKCYNDQAKDLGVSAFASGLPPENPTFFAISLLKEPITTEKMYLWETGPKTLEDYKIKESYHAGSQAVYVNYLATVNSGVNPFPQGRYYTCIKHSEEDLDKTEATFCHALKTLKKNKVVGKI